MNSRKLPSTSYLGFFVRPVVRRAAFKGVLALGGLALGSWLLEDSGTFVLMPAEPATSRTRGCYTTIELLVGVTSPSAIRPTELLVGAVLFFASMIWVVWGLGKSVRGILRGLRLAITQIRRT
jgi:hypothetical protein